jgi:hypothetical protein
MPAERGVVLLAVTLGLFQNGSIHRVAGKPVKIARTDTLSDPDAVDHFAYAPRPLDDVRAELNVVPKHPAVG